MIKILFSVFILFSLSTLYSCTPGGVVASGGDTTIDRTLTEDDLYKLELESFMRLIETKKTQERIKHTLATGKPLVN